jgi:hypothetical protein
MLNNRTSYGVAIVQIIINVKIDNVLIQIIKYIGSFALNEFIVVRNSFTHYHY